jgi:hypothetical protein
MRRHLLCGVGDGTNTKVRRRHGADRREGAREYRDRGLHIGFPTRDMHHAPYGRDCNRDVSEENDPHSSPCSGVVNRIGVRRIGPLKQAPKRARSLHFSVRHLDVPLSQGLVQCWLLS